VKTPPVCSCGQGLPTIEAFGVVFRCPCGARWVMGMRPSTLTLNFDAAFGAMFGGEPSQAPDTRQDATEDTAGRHHG
jgi:hypothetical protein